MNRTTLQPAGVIAVLLDTKAPFGDRHDAAMDLARFDEPEAERALSDCLLAKETDPDLADACAESVAELWARKRRIDRETLALVPPHATAILFATLDKLFPDWSESR